MTTKKKSPKRSTKKVRTPRPTARKTAKRSTSRSRTTAPAAARRFEATAAGKQALLDMQGVEPIERAPEQPGDRDTTVQTLRVTKREVRRWKDAALVAHTATGQSWGTLAPMTWARKVLNAQADSLLGNRT